MNRERTTRVGGPSLGRSAALVTVARVALALVTVAHVACANPPAHAEAPHAEGPPATAASGSSAATDAARRRGAGTDENRSGEGAGLYGELNGALALGVSGGAALLAGGSGSGGMPMWQAALDLFAFGTAGLKLGYDTVERDLGGNESLRRHALTFSLELRPLFLALFLTNRFTGSERLDLFLYSLGLEVGASYERTTLQQSGATDTGHGFHIGFGFEVPLWRRGDHLVALRFQLRGNFARDLPLGPALTATTQRATHSFDVLQLGLLLRYRFQFCDRL